jgi:hypothetical protein
MTHDFNVSIETLRLAFYAEIRKKDRTISRLKKRISDFEDNGYGFHR